MKLINGVEVKKLVRHKDERGFFEEIIRVSDDFFGEGFGQLSYSYMHHGVIKAWHVHKTQIDWWYVGEGTIKTALCDRRKDSETHNVINEFIMGEAGEDIVLKIPAGVAHGMKVIEGPAKLFYVTSKTYDTDEEGRIPHDAKDIDYDWLKGPPIE